jgi:hypothetical protein
MIYYQKFITRTDLRSNPKFLFVFGDNFEGWGYGGQASECRGEDNAVGIPTKVSPTKCLNDNRFEEWEARVDPLFKKLFTKDKLIVWPTDCIGTGLARLEVKAPLIWKELQLKIDKLKEYHEVL